MVPTFFYSFKSVTLPAFAQGCPWYDEPARSLSSCNIFTAGYANGVAVPIKSVPFWQKPGLDWPAFSTLAAVHEAEILPNGDAIKLLPYSSIRATSDSLHFLVWPVDEVTRTKLPENLQEKPWLSGGIDTWPYAQVGGTWEWVAQAGAGKGLWNAMWLFGQHSTDKSEIDFEILGDKPNVVYCSLHFTNAPSISKAVDVGVDLSLRMHKYTVTQNSQSVDFSLDGKIICNLPCVKFTTALTMIASLAVGDAKSWPGAPVGPFKYPIGKMCLESMTAWAT